MLKMKQYWEETDSDTITKRKTTDVACDAELQMLLPLSFTGVTDTSNINTNENNNSSSCSSIDNKMQNVLDATSRKKSSNETITPHNEEEDLCLSSKEY